MSRCVQLLEVDAAGLLFTDDQGRLRATIATSQSARSLDLLQVEDGEGPGVECYRTVEPVAVNDLDDPLSRWPRFAALASDQGFGSVLALPMRLRDEVIGVLNLLTASGRAPAGHQVTRLGQSMADVATIAILQFRLAENRRVLNEQLEQALGSRVLVEQAKGVLVTRLGVGSVEAFGLLRARARHTRRVLDDVADEVLSSGPETDWEDYRKARPGSDE